MPAVGHTPSVPNTATSHTWVNHWHSFLATKSPTYLCIYYVCICIYTHFDEALKKNIGPKITPQMVTCPPTQIVIFTSSGMAKKKMQQHNFLSMNSSGGNTWFPLGGPDEGQARKGDNTTPNNCYKLCTGGPDTSSVQNQTLAQHQGSP